MLSFDLLQKNVTKKRYSSATYAYENTLEKKWGSESSFCVPGHLLFLNLCIMVLPLPSQDGDMTVVPAYSFSVSNSKQHPGGLITQWGVGDCS